LLTWGALAALEFSPATIRNRAARRSKICARFLNARADPGVSRIVLAGFHGESVVAGFEYIQTSINRLT